ncbi:hypothetical protein J0E37_001702, partial [Campylobacter upsaliensis]|nr:hypothetical protein [Campylobacter upsaliensis]
MRNLERDLGKIELKIKEKESVKESEKMLESDLLDKTKPLRKAEKEELTKEVLEQVQKENLKLYLNHTNENLTHFLKLEKPLKITMRGANIKHILNRHGENSTLAKNGQPFVSLEDIKNYDEYINNADKQILKENDKGEKTLLSGKQINGYYIVISSVRLKNGELKLKTMYKENGSLENNEAFKGVKLPSETPSVLQGQSLTTNLDGYPSHAEDIIAQKAKSENTQDFKPFNDAMKELYTKYESLGSYDKIEAPIKMKLLQDEIKPEIARYFKGIIAKLKQGENKDKMLRVIRENREELSDYLAFNIAVRKDIYIDGYGEGQFDFYDKSIQAFAKLRENKRVNEINEDSNYRALAALENLRDKNTALHFSFRDLNGKSEAFKTYPRKQDLLFDDLTLGDDFKSSMLLSTKDKQLKEKLIEKLKTYIDEKLYRDFLEYKIKDLESKNPKNSFFENYENKKWNEEAFEDYKKELEDLRANERAEKLEDKIKEKESVKEKIKNAKTSPYPQNADEAVRIQSISKQELEQSNPQQSHLSTKESIAQKALMQRKSPILNDEPLEVEIIEEAGLNEPMKFLEFQQKKLLTYIKQNTPLRLLERKIELKTRDILNFLEQSALNGKEKAFLMRNFE